MPSNRLILFRPLLLLPSVFPSIRIFSSESVLHIRWPNYWSFSISPSKEHSGLISFRIDWSDIFAVQGTLKSLQHPSSKASILQHSVFFMVQLSHPHMTVGKTIALTIWTFVAKWCLCFLKHCLGLTYTCSSKEQASLISWLQSLSALILEPKKMKSDTVYTFFPSICHGSDKDWMPSSSFFEFWVLNQLFNAPLSLSSRGSLVPLHFLPLKWYHLHLWDLLFLRAILIPACDSSSLAFHMMYSTYKLNKQW